MEEKAAVFDPLRALGVVAVPACLLFTCLSVCLSLVGPSVCLPACLLLMGLGPVLPYEQALSMQQ